MFNIDSMNGPFPEVHIWMINLDNIFEYPMDIFSKKEKERANKFRHDKSRNTYLKCRYVLRKLLGMYVRKDASKISLITNQYGKPILLPIQNTKRVSFNISHTDSLACVVIALNTEVGVDIEKVRPLSGELEDMIQIFMNESEIKSFNKIIHQRDWAFFHTWTQKEAVLKAKGTGFSLDPTSFKTYITSRSNLRNMPINDWIINSYRFSEHILSICTTKKVKPLFYQFPFEDHILKCEIEKVNFPTSSSLNKEHT